MARRPRTPDRQGAGAGGGSAALTGVQADWPTSRNSGREQLTTLNCARSMS